MFSRAIPTVLLLLVQLLIFIGVAVFLNEYFYVFQIFSTVLGFLVFLYVVNKKEHAEYKLPWLFLFVALPYFGILFYLIFANPSLGKRQSKKLTAVQQKLSALPPPAAHTPIPDACADAEHYLQHTSKTVGSTGNRTTYFKLGEDFFADLITELKTARHFIFMEYFIIKPGEMWQTIYDILRQKVKEGVEVRVIYDDVGSLGELYGNYYKKLRHEGIRCVKFNPIRPVLSGIHNNRDHRKITVIDGRVGYTGGVNIGDEYINKTHPLKHWKDTAIKIEGPAVYNLTSLFLEIFDLHGKHFSDYDAYLNIPYPMFENGGYVHPFGDGPKPYYEEQIGEWNFINLIHHAKRYIYITTPYVVIDYSLSMALKNAALRGVDVRIIVPHVPDKKIIHAATRSHYPFLMKAGVRIYEYTPGFIHAKGVLVDDEWGFVGTINLDYRSLVHHFECGALLWRPPCLADIKKDMLETMEVSEEITEQNFKMNKLLAKTVTATLCIFYPLL